MSVELRACAKKPWVTDYFRLMGGGVMLALGFVLLGVCLVFGGAVVLLRTAKKPKVPKGFKPRIDEEDDSNGW